MPPATSVFGSKLNSQVYAPSNADSDQPNNAFKIPVLEFFRGEFKFLYERKIIKGMNVELGFGASFAGDFVNIISSYIMGGLWGILRLKSGPIYSVLPLKKMLSDGSFDAGFIYSIALRHYFEYGSNSPSFVDFSFKNVSQSFTLSGSRYSTFDYSNKFLTLNLGNSWQSEKSNPRFIHSLAIGIGAKLGRWDEYLQYTKGNLIYDYFYKSGNIRSGISPLFIVKYNVGLCW
jgi:hypothetical protein